MGPRASPAVRVGSVPGSASRGANPDAASALNVLARLHLLATLVGPILVLLSPKESAPAEWLLVGIFGLVSITLYLWAKRPDAARGWPRVGYMVLAFDLIAITVQVWTRGGLSTDTYHFYYLLIVGSGIVFGVIESLLMAVCAGLAYGLAVQLTGGEAADLARVAIRTIYFALTGAAAAYLAARERSQRLAQAQTQRFLADLQEAHAQLKRYARDMSERAVTDGLTRLFNHTYFHQRLEEEMSRARRYDRPLSLLMLDLDDFKRYNDNHGHLEGDGVLTTVGAVLAAAVRHEDVACRYGGEEFAIIMPETDTEAARAAAERVRDAIQQRFAHRDPGPLTVSIGVASFPDHAQCRVELIEAADRALYLSKRVGKNRVSAHGGGARTFLETRGCR